MSNAIWLAALVLVYGILSRRLSTTIVTGPIVFTAFGLIMGAAGLGLIDLSLETETITVIGEVTLVLVLFTDAARIDIPRLRTQAALPLRMLASLPLVIALGGAIAMLVFPDLELFTAGVLGAVLAPTDATLGQVVVTDDRIPVRIRQTLNVESGLNDGIVLPFVTILLSLAGAQDGVESVGTALAFVGGQIGYALLIGVGIGCAAAYAVDWASERGWMTKGYQQLATLAVALMIFGLSEAVGGNGFIAAFVGGLAFGSLASHRLDELYEFAEQEGALLTVVIFVILGASLVPDLITGLDLRTAAYVVLSLTVVRMVPIALSLLGTGLRASSVAFLAWFGPRGLATILFGLLVVEQADLEQGSQILSIALWTVLASVVAHGLSAVPLVGLYTRSLHSVTTEEEDMAEMQEMTEFPTRVPGGMESSGEVKA
ncbi:cation:proton antiporter [soil metagenome]